MQALTNPDMHRAAQGEAMQRDRGGGQLQAHAGGISGSWLCAGRVPNGVGQAATFTALMGSRSDLGP